ncbi:MAG: sn-glycerol-1-phosphate dehydrogenase, partial [Thermoguttaceae bacterium]|nr:sn-glycerol-1-phosphate dehydrogenase [Thermoguttaceae bacterium]
PVADLAARLLETAKRPESTLWDIYKADLLVLDDLGKENLTAARLAAIEAVPIAFGSGTVNDLTKYSSSLCDRPYMVVGTAASMDGYTSFGASIEYQSYKQTFSCPAPYAVLIDLEIIEKAPLAMNASGYADLAAKIPAGADWILADFIGTEPIDRPAWDLVQVPLRDWMKTAAGIPRRDPAALLALIEGLIMSGLAMQKAKSSRTASGAEHLFSHLWDNQHHEYNGIAPSHGFKVGIGTITTSALYDQILTLDSSVFDKALETLTDRFPDWNQIERKVRCSFTEPGLIDNALKQCRLKYVDQTECRRRLTLYREHWNELRKQLREQCMTAAGIQKLIAECGAPSRPEEIGIDRTRLRKSCELAQLIRCRYNILDWLLETGQWDEQINQLFIRGFWV